MGSTDETDVADEIRGEDELGDATHTKPTAKGRKRATGRRGASNCLSAVELESLSERLKNLPDCMATARRWLLWRREPNKNPSGKDRKVPYYVNGRRRANALDGEADRRCLASLPQALEALQTGGFSGLGFALGPDEDGGYWQGVDLDDLPEHPELASLAESLPGYVETSPSGKGKHAIGFGRHFKSYGSNGSGCEAYAAARFFTVTGEDMAGEPECLADFVAKHLALAHARRGEEGPAEPPIRDNDPPSPDQVSDLRSALSSLPSDDRELWVRMGHALKTAGSIGHDLWLRWSRGSHKHDPVEDARTWEGLKPTKTHWKRVFAEARERGWTNPARRNDLVPHAPPQAESGFPLVQVGDLLANLQPIDWLIRNFIEADTLVQLYGQPSAGKSFVALDMALCIATGTIWHGHPVKQGSAIYIAGEGKIGIGRRLKAWSRHRGVELRNAPLFVSERSAALMDRACVDSIALEVECIALIYGPPAVIVVDTMARNLGQGDENSNADVGLFIKRLDELRAKFNAAVVIVHHTGHGHQERARGASCLRAAVDHEFKCELTNSTVSLTCSKAKESEAAPPMHFELHQVAVDTDAEDGRDICSAVLTSVEKAPRRLPKLTDSQRFALENYMLAARTAGTLNSKGEFEGLHLDDWRPLFYEASTADSTKTKNQQFNRARKDLVDRGKLAVKDNIYRLTGEDSETQHEEIAFDIYEREHLRPSSAEGGTATARQERYKTATCSAADDDERDATRHTPIGVSRVAHGQPVQEHPCSETGEADEISARETNEH